MINMINHHHHHHNNNSSGGNFSEKMQRTQEYIEALEEERRKIQVFQRELPLCFELVTQAIDTCKQQLSVTTEYNFHGQSECSEQTSTEGPVLEEFIPLKRCSSSDDDELQSHKTKKNGNNKERLDGKNNDKASSKKSDWLRSVQLWNQTPDPPAKEESPRKIPVVEVKSNGNGGAFHPFKKDKSVGTSAAAAAIQPAVTSGRSSGPAAAASSTADTGGNNGGGSGGGGGGECKKEEKEKEGQSHRKARRCWSPELHKRFLMALQQLGGSHVATPKQIRELMKVDGLTNDEVKSHLQKYRLHNRRPSSSIHNNNNPQAPQFVVVGGIWVPPPEYAAMGTNTGSGEASGGANSNGIYAPIATLASPLQDASVSIKQRQHHKQSHSDDQASHSGGVHHSRSSPVTSSSTDTTTASPTY